MTLRRRALGSTGLLVAELGLGAMDTPHSPEAAATLATAVDLGIDFVDTAREYAGSEFLIGQFIRERGRKNFIVGSKTFSRTVHGSQRDVDRSLSVLGLERIDLYQLHDVSTASAWADVMGPNGGLEGLRIARERGLIGHIGVSSHDEAILRLAIDCGAFATVMVEYSAFYPGTADLISRAAERGVGVIVMRPLGGSGRTSVLRGRLAAGTAGVLSAANLLRYVLSHPGVSVAIPGARYPDRVRVNVAAVASYVPMSAAERTDIEAAAKELY